MTPIDFNCTSAFAPFFDEVVSIEGRRKSDDGPYTLSGTALACVLENGFSDPMVDVDADSDVRVFSVSIRRSDWIDRSRPAIGDRIVLTGRDGLKLAVSRVDADATSWTLTAREVR